MKAVVVTKSGSPDVLEFRVVEKPTPREKEILIKVHAGTVTRGDVALRSLSRWITVPVGFLMGFKPMDISGVEFAGVVESVGKEVKNFKSGDEVFGTTTGLRYGANAEYVCVPEKWKMGVVAKKPKNVSFAEAAVVPVGGMTALFILKKGGLKKGDKVLVYGASGSVGSFAVQLAKHFGAEVTGVCSTRNVAMVKSLGADHVLDYTKDDFTSHEKKYDIVFDAVGKLKRSACTSALKEGGRYVSVKFPTSEKLENLELLKELVETGKIKPFIDKTFPLAQTAEAHRYVDQGHKKGNVVIMVQD